METAIGVFEKCENCLKEETEMVKSVQSALDLCYEELKRFKPR